jgi:hypothetical protein
MKHLEKFPEDGVLQALENVLGFDAYNEDLRGIIAGVFRRRG